AHPGPAHDSGIPVGHVGSRLLGVGKNRGHPQIRQFEQGTAHHRLDKENMRHAGTGQCPGQPFRAPHRLLFAHWFPPAYRVNPPSTMTVWPVIIAPPAQRKKIVSAMSSGLQARLSGVRSTVARFLSSGQSFCHGLSTWPGATALTRTSGAKVRAKARVRLISPALLLA